MIPELRFNDDTTEWMEDTLGNNVIFLDNQRKPVSELERIAGDYPYYGANGIQDYINDYIFDGKYLLLGEDGSVMDVNGHPIVNLVDDKFWANNHVHILKEVNSDIDYLFYAASLSDVSGFKHGNIPKLNKEDAKLIIIPIPEKHVQTEIATLLSDMDAKIKAQSEKVENLKQIKASMLVKMFPQEGQKVPEIRFDGFSGDWDEKPLSEIADKVTRKNTDKSVTETFTNSAEFGVMSQIDFFDKEISNDANTNNYYVVEPYNFVYNPRVSTLAPVGPINCNKLGRTGVMSPLYTVFAVHDVDYTFLDYTFSNSAWHSYMYKNGNTGARHDRFSITDDLFFAMPFMIPSLPEQTAIGNFFKTLDKKIALETEKLDKFTQIKKALLNKLLP